MLYVTPEKFRTMGFGIDLEGIEDFELVSILNRSSAVAEGYCSVPRLPLPHSFLGGTISVDRPEQHGWRLPENDFDIGQRRVYPYHWPIKEVLQFKIKVTNTQYVTIAPTEIFVNNSERYIEVISLAFTGVGLFGAIMPSLGLMRPVAEIAYTYGWNFVATNERLYATDARTYRAQNQFWDDTDVEVRVSGTVQTSGFTLDRTEGVVIFDDQLGAEDYVDIDYGYTLDPSIRDGVGEIGTYLLGQRESAARGMSGIGSLKVAEVTITKPHSASRLHDDGSNLAELCPSAATLLAGNKFMTARG